MKLKKMISATIVAVILVTSLCVSVPAAGTDNFEPDSDIPKAGEGIFLEYIRDESNEDTLVFDICCDDSDMLGIAGFGVLVDYSENITLSSVKKIYSSGLLGMGQDITVKPYMIVWIEGTAVLPYEKTAVIRLTFDVTGNTDEKFWVNIYYDEDNGPIDIGGDAIEPEKIPASGVEYDYGELVHVHDLVYYNEKAPTCTEIGWKAYEMCRDCDYTTYAELPKDSSNHVNTEVRGVIEATPEAGGYTGDTYCKDCDTLLEKGETVVFAGSTPGDANRDGKINVADASAILKYVAKWDVEIDIDAADVNDDGKVNVGDVSLLLKYIAKWDVELK